MSGYIKTAILVAMLALLSACGDNQTNTEATGPVVDATAGNDTATDASLADVLAVDDYHSYSNPADAVVRHIELDLQTDFTARVLKGTATLTVERVNDSAEVLRLDTRDLDIQDVRVQNTAGKWVQAYYQVGAADPNMGAPLEIELPQPTGEPLKVRVRYRTAPGASGLQWLEPEQTAGKKHPFLFSQSQAIHARSWIPLQDSPAVRVTYNAKIKTPVELLAVMSASNDPQTPRDGEYEFTMPQAIPSYLIAIGVGNLSFEPMGARTGVYAEPEVVEAAAAEFADTEKMLEITEDLFGPYRWGRYDLLILPPSFPFGGMENPRLSFITPTVIAGDKSLVSLIAHELAHSWSGNLVTNATWRDLWLNEGFTSYLESRIMEAVYGSRRSAMEDTLGYQGLLADIERLPDEAEILAIDLRGQDPDNVFSSIPYTKGQLFLNWLEQYFGREQFDVFLREYFDHFAFRSISTDQFIHYLQDRLPSTGPSQQELNAWIFEPGLPDDAVIPTSDAFERVATQRQAWLNGDLNANQIKTEDWTVHEWLAFINNLPEKLSQSQLTALDKAFDLTTTRNNEIAHSWLKVAIRNDYDPAYARLESYLVEIGRLKLVRPLYQELVKTEKGKVFAERVYQQARPGYHPLTQRVGDGIVLGEVGDK